MTRKCIICKSKNYKNACSFFSAPKDPGARRLWQEAINIDDYIVNDETYVCSKHFKKDDIITHWVSGVPPQVITIKYKKCRLRQGAVPIPINSSNHLQDEISLNLPSNRIVSKEKNLVETDEKEINNSTKVYSTGKAMIDSFNCNLEDEIYEYIPEDSQEPEESDSEITSNETFKKQKLMPITNDEGQVSYSTSQNEEILYIDCRNLNRTDVQEHEDNIQLRIDNTHSILTYHPKKPKNTGKEFHKITQSYMTDRSEQITSSPINWHVEGLTEKLEINGIEEFSSEFNKDGYDRPSKSLHKLSDINNSMLFEDFLEIYNEASLPSSWFASMICKGHDTTIVYCCMNISSSGMPFVEKEVFLNSEMILRCGVLNKEIDKNTFGNLGKSFNVHTLMDIENFIEEFDQRPICTGILDGNSVNQKSPHFAVFHGNTWRHSNCLMVLSKGQARCFQCTSLMTDQVH